MVPRRLARCCTALARLLHSCTVLVLHSDCTVDFFGSQANIVNEKGANMTPYHHALSSAKRFGGAAEDYIEIHNWFDETKGFTGDWTHRALRHHSAGVEWAIERFGHTVLNSDNKKVPVKFVAEQHVEEDCGFIPTVQDWLGKLSDNPEDWMLRVAKKRIEHELKIGE